MLFRSGRFAARAQIGSFTVSIRDTTSPVATVGKLASPKKGSTYTFKVVHSDNVAVRAATVGHSDVIVTGPKRFKQAAKLVSKSSKTNAGRIIATYRIVAPGKSWDAADKGVYTITLQRRQVSDTSGNIAAAKKIGKFSYVPLKAKAKKLVKKADVPATNLRRAAAQPAVTPFSTRPIQSHIGESPEPVWA